jgi:hypothetical protein
MPVAERVTLAAAALALGKSPATMRRWVSLGCPVVSPGGPGRGKGATFDLAAVRRWKASGGAPGVQHEEWLRRVAEAFLAFHRERAHRLIGLRDPHAAAYLHDLFAFIARRVGADVKPAELEQLEAIALQVKPRTE